MPGLYAQNWNFGINLNVGIPQGSFKDNVDRAGIGVSGAFGRRLQSLPVMLGLEAGFIKYGSEDQDVPVIGRFPDLTVRVNTSNNIVQGHFLFRIQPKLGAVQPYIDGLAGFNYLYTRTLISSDLFWENQELSSKVNFSDFALSYGAGGGLAITVHDRTQKREETGEGYFKLLVDLKLRYIIGHNAEYLTKGSITRVNDMVIYDVSKSKTNLISVQLGIMFFF